LPTSQLGSCYETIFASYENKETVLAELKIGLPKGSLQDSTFDLLQKAGWKFSVSSRSYYPRCDDPELSAMLARPQEMSRYVERGVLDAASRSRALVYAGLGV